MTADCDACTETKPRFVKPPETNLVKATQSMERLCLDFKGPIAGCTRYRYMVTASKRITSRVEPITLKLLFTTSLIELLVFLPINNSNLPNLSSEHTLNIGESANTCSQAYHNKE